MNTNIVLVTGKPATGKSLSLMNLRKPEGVMYLGCESNKALPFKSKFMELTVTDPMQVYEAFDEAENMPEIHTIVVDSLSYLMDMFESLNVVPFAGTKTGMSAWGDYAQFFKKLMSQYVARSTKSVILTAHTLDVMNESEAIMETLVKVKGSIMNSGVEAAFTNVISTKKIALKKLKDFDNDLLTINEDEEEVGFKYVFQTRLTKETVNERMRHPLRMWSRKETYIDNDLQNVLDRIKSHYED